MAKDQNSSSSIAGIVVGGCLFIGMGIGMLMGHITTGLFVGLGVGLLGMAGVMMYYKGRS